MELIHLRNLIISRSRKRSIRVLCNWLTPDSCNCYIQIQLLHNVPVSSTLNMSFAYLDNLCRCITRCHHIDELEESLVYAGMINITGLIEFIPENTLIDIVMKVTCCQAEHFMNVYMTYQTITGILRQLEKFGCIDLRANKDLKIFCRDLYLYKATVYDMFQAIYVNLEPHKVKSYQLQAINNK